MKEFHELNKINICFDIHVGKYMYILVRTWVYMDVNKAGCILVGEILK